MLEIFLLLFGLILLVLGAHYLVKGSSKLAKKFGVSSLVVGLSIVAIGTSLPELFVNIFASASNHPDISLGNILGSNIVNLLLILGISIIILGTLKVSKSTIKYEVPFALFIIVVLLMFSSTIFSVKPILGILAGSIFLVLFIVFVYYLYTQLKISKVIPEAEFKNYSMINIIFMILGGCVLMYFGGEWTVKGAVFIARSFSISEFLISATIVALGTSLPEFATSIIAIRKGEIDISVGNIIGSNIINIAFILGISALISPIPILGYVLFDILFLFGGTCLLLFFVLYKRRYLLERWQGIVFVALYVIYILFLILR